MSTGKFEEAVTDANAMIGISDTDPAGYLCRGLALEALGKIPEAFNSYVLAFERDPNDSSIRASLERAQVSRQKEALLESIELFQGATVAFRPDNPDLLVEAATKVLFYYNDNLATEETADEFVSKATETLMC